MFLKTLGEEILNKINCTFVLNMCTYNVCYLYVIRKTQEKVFTTSKVQLEFLLKEREKELFHNSDIIFPFAFII